MEATELSNSSPDNFIVQFTIGNQINYCRVISSSRYVSAPCIISSPSGAEFCEHGSRGEHISYQINSGLSPMLSKLLYINKHDS